MNLIELTNYCLRQAYMQDDDVYTYAGSSGQNPVDKYFFNVLRIFNVVAESFLKKRLFDFSIVSDLNEIDFNHLNHNNYYDYVRLPSKTTATSHNIVHAGEKITFKAPGSGSYDILAHGVAVTGSWQVDTYISSFSASGVGSEAGICIAPSFPRPASDLFNSGDSINYFNFYLSGDGNLRLRITNSNDISLGSASDPIYLRVIKNDDNYLFYTSSDGVTYSLVATRAVDISSIYASETQDVCLYASSDTGDSVFDYFRFTRNDYPYVIKREDIHVRNILAVSIDNIFIPGINILESSPSSVAELKWYYQDGKLFFTTNLDDYIGSDLRLWTYSLPLAPGLSADADFDESMVYLIRSRFLRFVLSDTYSSSFWEAVDAGNSSYSADGGQKLKNLGSFLKRDEDFFYSILKNANDRRYVLNQI